MEALETITKQKDVVNNRLAELLRQQKESEEKLGELKKEIEKIDKTLIILTMDLSEFELLEDVFTSGISFVRTNKKQREDYGRLFQNLYLQKHGQTNKTQNYASNV